MNKNSHITMRYACLVLLFLLSSNGFALTIEITEGIESEPAVNDVDQRVTPGFVSIINQSQFGNANLQLSDVLDQETSVNVRHTSGMGSFALANIRGKSADQVSVYLDGILVNDPQAGGVDLSLFSTSNIETIEIYKDTIPIQFPVASIGGVINIKTLRNQKTERRLNLGFGSFGTMNYKGLYKSQLKNTSFMLSAEYLESANDYPFVYDQGTPDNPENHIATTRHNNQFRQTTFLTKLQTSVSKNNSLSLQIEGMEKLQGLPSIINASNAQTEFNQDHLIAKAQWSNTKNTLRDFSFSVDINSKTKNMYYDDELAQVSLVPQIIDYKNQANEISLFGKWDKDTFQLLTTAALSNEEFIISDKTDDITVKSNNTRLSGIVGIQSHAFFHNSSIIVSPAIRYHRVSDNRKSNKSSPGFNSSYYTPQLGIKILASHSLSLKSNISRYYRMPSFLELYGGRGYIGANGKLQAESGINSDLGIEYETYPQSRWLTKFKLQSALFYSVIDDEIVFINNGQDKSIPVNLQLSRIIGLENHLGFEFFYDMNLTFNTTLQNAINQMDTGNRALPGRTPISQYIKLSYEPGKYKVYTEASWDAGFYFDSMEQIYSNPKNIINSGASYFWKQWEVSLDIKNITNTQYRNYFFQPVAGRYFYVSAQLSF